MLKTVVRFRITLMTVVISLLGCAPPNNDIQKQSLLYCSEGAPETFNPQLITSGTTIDATARQLYDRLLDYDSDKKAFVPAIAKRWNVSDDGLTYRFYLNENFQFHKTKYFTPTRALNADDVLFSFNRWRQLNHPYNKISGGIYPFFQGLGIDLLIKDIRKLDQHSIEIEINQPTSSFLANLATDFAIILSAEYGQQLLDIGQPELMDKQPIGTGPFKFLSYTPNRVIRYQQHENYWRENSKVKQLIFDITRNDQMRLAKLITKECDVIAYPVTSELDVIRDNEKLQLQEQIGLNVGFWAFNTQKPPFDNVLVRQALSQAVDIDTILKAVYYGTATKAKNILPPSSWAYEENLPNIEYSPEKARALLAKAGYENGFSMDIWAMPIQRPYNPNAQKMAQLIQADLQKIGVQATIVSYEWRVFRERVSQGYHDSVLLGWTADNADPDNFFNPLLSCSSVMSGTNRALWCNEEFDHLISMALTSQNIEERRFFYNKAQQYIISQAPLLSIAHANRYQAQRSNVSGMGISPYGGINMAQIDKEQP